MNNQQDSGGDEPRDDTFDHFFSQRPTHDPDATRPVPQVPPAGGPDDATMAWVPERAGRPQQPGQQPGQPPGQGWPPEGPPAGSPAERSRRKGVLLPVLVIAASLIVIGVVAFIALGSWGSTSTQASHSTPLATEAPSQSGPGPSSPSSSEAPPRTSQDQPTSGTEQALPAGAIDCHSSNYSVGPKTSCEFGQSVAQAADSADFSGGSGTLENVYSSTTKKKYTLTCTKAGYLTCVSTTGALVYVKIP